MFDQLIQCRACQIEIGEPSAVAAAVPGGVTAMLIGLPVALWVGLIVAGSVFFGAPVLAAVAGQMLAVVGLLLVATRRRPPRPVAIGLDKCPGSRRLPYQRIAGKRLDPGR